nr:unnamed protein product [Spirometra erinaceieuropaei]
MRRALLEETWLVNNEDSEEFWQYFCGIIESLIDSHCPIKITRPCERPPWVNSTTKKAMKKKQRLWKKYMQLRDPVSLAEYKDQRNKCRKQIRIARTSFERRLVAESITCPKKFYKYIPSRRKHRDEIACLKDSLGNLLVEGPQKVQLLSEFFQSVFTEESSEDDQQFEMDRNSRDFQMRQDTAVIETVAFSVGEVRRVLSQIKPDKSPGPDGIPGLILKELSKELAKPLSTLFELSMRTGRLPSQWKTANLVPLHKGGSRMAASCFRPISLTCLSCKTMEALVKSAIQQFCEENNLLQDFQHGFQRGRSCLSNLLACLEIWTRALEEGFEVDVVYIDFRKAFDTVPHQRLLHKLSAIGIRGDLLNWIGAFLVGRKQRVCIGDDMSEWVSVTSGVPQGSVLGPLLFLLYVNDSLQELDCGKIMFADNVKLWQVIKSPNDQRSLQNNLHRLQAWSEKWLLDFNVQKCAVLHLRPTNSHSNQSLRTYHLKDIRLPAES